MQKIGGILSEILSEMLNNPEVARVFLRELWPQMVGAELAGKIQPEGLTRGTLGVSAVDPEWEKAIREMLPLLKQSVNSFWNYPLVERIVVRRRLG